jgi:cell wall assembly regulator SMI1
MAWGGSEPWVVAAASESEAGSAGWDVVASALASASAARGHRVAAVVIGSASVLPRFVATHVAVERAARADDAVRVANALAPTHDLVLVTAPGGLLAPLGDYTLADVAWVLRSPVVIAADTANQAALTLEAVNRRHLAAAVVAVGPEGEFAGLPVGVAGVIPPDAADSLTFAADAPGWLDPLLGGVRGVAPEDRPAEPAAEGEAADEPTAGQAPLPEAAPPTRLISGKRVAIALLILIIVALQVIYMINVMSDDPEPTSNSVQLGATVDVDPRTAVPVPAPLPVCPEGRLVGVATVADAATSARVAAAWTRIDTFLAARAPATAAALRAGAPPERIAATQARMSVAFPPDLVASLARHDGMSTLAAGSVFPPLYRAIGTDELYRFWRTVCDVVADVGVPDSGWWNAAFVPFAEDGGGNALFVDQRTGRVGEFDHESGVRLREWPSPFAAFLEAVATSVETGQPFAGRYRPQVDADGALGWDV